MLVEGASRIVPAGEVEIDSGAFEFGSASLYGGDKRSSDAFAPLIARNPQVTHPQTLLTRMRFEPSAERGKAHNAI